MLSIFPGKLFDTIDSRSIDYLSILKCEERGRQKIEKKNY